MDREIIKSDLISITIDVDWACPEVLNDTLSLLNERGISGTIFCTHPGINAPGHELALHPNFRRNGDSMIRLKQEVGNRFEGLSETEIYKYIVKLTRSFCPEATGVRAHSLFYDSLLLPIYHEAGLRYESSYLLPLTEGLHPVWKEYDILEIPIYFNDHFELKSGMADFKIENLHLEKPGLKVFQFHPNMLFINAATNEQYLESKPYYHHYKKLLSLRNNNRGARTLFLDLLDWISANRLQTATLSEVNSEWRNNN
ncbi:MAG: hypothetical protein Q7T53_09045 [Deltaproteobacteria bacterium]|nr:hypothetical protein [Deltaproteobacteria bacterium]